MEKINDSRQNILAKIKSGKPEARPLPEIPHYAIPGKPLQNFIAHLKGFDGDYRLFDNRENALMWVKENVVSSNPDKKIFCSLADLKGNVSLSDFNTPAEMNIVDIGIGEALMAVGETGSLLVDTESLGAPAAALFSTDLYLLIDRNELVAGLQQAYANIDLTRSRYTAFFSGPSATADIEAVHITGAQGEISLTAILYNCSEDDMAEVKKIMDRLPSGTPLGQPDAPVLKLKRETDPTSGIDSI